VSVPIKGEGDRSHRPKDDLQGEADRDVNPVSLIEKLLAILAASSLSIILVINVVLVAASLRR
jgi:hypothetical protein